MRSVIKVELAMDSLAKNKERFLQNLQAHEEMVRQQQEAAAAMAARQEENRN